MNTKIFILVLLCATDCGRNEMFSDWNKKIQPTLELEKIKREEPIAQLKVLLDSFISDCRDKYGADISDVNRLESIRYGDPSTLEQPLTAGICYSTHLKNGKLIKSNIVVKEIQDPTIAKALLYHELGHCVLGLEHTSQESKTLMSPTMLTSTYYSDNWDNLVEDLCHKYIK